VAGTSFSSVALVTAASAATPALMARGTVCAGGASARVGGAAASQRRPAATSDELATRGVGTGEIQPVSKGVELSATTDPDGNAITLIGNFREKY
jgi:hypothetical protein